MIRYFSQPILRQIGPEIMTVGDGVIDVHVETEDIPAGRYRVIDINDGIVTAELIEGGEVTDGAQCGSDPDAAATGAPSSASRIRTRR